MLYISLFFSLPNNLLPEAISSKVFLKITLCSLLRTVDFHLFIHSHIMWQLSLNMNVNMNIWTRCWVNWLESIKFYFLILDSFQLNENVKKSIMCGLVQNRIAFVHFTPSQIHWISHLYCFTQFFLLNFHLMFIWSIEFIPRCANRTHRVIFDHENNKRKTIAEWISIDTRVHFLIFFLWISS